MDIIKKWNFLELERWMDGLLGIWFPSLVLVSTVCLMYWIPADMNIWFLFGFEVYNDNEWVNGKKTFLIIKRSQSLKNNTSQVPLQVEFGWSMLALISTDQVMFPSQAQTTLQQTEHVGVWIEYSWLHNIN